MAEVINETVQITLTAAFHRSMRRFNCLRQSSCRCMDESSIAVIRHDISSKHKQTNSQYKHHHCRHRQLHIYSAPITTGVLQETGKHDNQKSTSHQTLKPNAIRFIFSYFLPSVGSATTCKSPDCVFHAEGLASGECTDAEIILQLPFYSHYTGQPALAGTSSYELEDFVGTKFHCLHALADGTNNTIHTKLAKCRYK